MSVQCGQCQENKFRTLYFDFCEIFFFSIAINKIAQVEESVHRYVTLESELMKELQEEKHFESKSKDVRSKIKTLTLSYVGHCDI